MPRNYSNAKSLKDVEQAFTYKKPKPDQVERYEELMGCAKLFAKLVTERCPPCKETEAAINHIQMANLMAIAAIDRHDKPADLL